MTTISELEDVVRQQQAELDRLREEVGAWRGQYESGRKRDVAYTNSATEVAPLYTALDLENSAGTAFELPGQWPFTRGIHPTGYRGKLWTMRQFAGFGTARETNQRYKFLLSQGQTGLSVAFDFPTLMGYDSDHIRSEGEVGKCGVAISSLADMTGRKPGNLSRTLKTISNYGFVEMKRENRHVRLIAKATEFRIVA